MYVAGVSKMTALANHGSGEACGDLSTSRKSPGRTEYEAITLERGVTHDPGSSLGQLVWQINNGLGTAYLPEFPQTDDHDEVYNEAGQAVLAYTVFRCWVSGIPGVA